MKYFLPICFIFIVTACSLEHNKPVPKDVFSYEFISDQSLSDGYFLSAPLKIESKPEHSNYISPKPIIIDRNGLLFWYMNTSAMSTSDFKYFPQDSLFGFTRTNDGISTYFLMDLQFNLVDSFFNVEQVRQDAHEFIKLKNGNYVIGGMKDSIMDLSYLNFNEKPGSKKTIVRGYVIQEFDKQHNLMFQWNSNDHIHPKESFESYGYDSTKYDYAHGNSIEEDVDGNLLVSLRYLNTVCKINHQTGKIIWKLGGKESDFIFVNDPGFSGQHDVRILPNGSISLFDNANTSVGVKKTRAVIYKLNQESKKAIKQWEFTADFFAKSMGGYQVHNAKWHLINFGYVFRPNPSVLMVDSNRNPLVKISFHDSVMSYRTVYTLIPFKIKPPVILGARYDNKTILMGPEGYKRYRWSNGDTTQFTIVDDSGIYQVWVNSGVGMLGSIPYMVNEKLTNDFWLLDNKMNRVNAPETNQFYYIKTNNTTVKAIKWP